MQIVANGLWTLVNGAYAAITGLIDPLSLAVLVAAGSLGWLGRVETAEMDRKGTKPVVRRH